MDSTKMELDAFPDMKGEIEDMVAEGDEVVVRVINTGTHTATFYGIPATGKKVAIEAMLVRVKDGKVVESWAITDTFGTMMQLGVTQMPRAPQE